MHGVAEAPAAISLVNAIPAGRGAAAAIDRHVTARVTLDADSGEVTGATTDGRPVDTTLIERCVAATTAAYGDGAGGHVETSAEVPAAVGLKTSSAAANATIVATLEALGCVDDVDPVDAMHLGVDVAREVGVTVTGALDDAAASMLGGLVLTDNTHDRVLEHRRRAGTVVVVYPTARQPTAAVDVASLEAVAPLGTLAADLVADGHEALGMAVNGLGVAAALELDTEVLAAGLSATPAVSYSGTGPAVAAIVTDEAAVDALSDAWDGWGEVLVTSLDNRGTVNGRSRR